MNDDRSFERTARAWLELGADQAPDRAVQAVLLAIETTPQERDLRIPWRFPTMNTPLRVGMAAVVGLLLLGAGIYLFGGSSPGIGGPPPPSPGPTLAASPSPVTLPPLEFTERFDSPLHGISINYPSGWQTRPATEPWTGGELNFDSPAADVIFDPALGDRLYFALASQPWRIPADGWDLLDSTPDFCRLAQDLGFDRAELGGLTGGNSTFPGGQGHAFFSRSCGSHAVEVKTDTRGYLILMYREPGLPDRRTTYDSAFSSAVETVHLRPEEALDALSPSASP